MVCCSFISVVLAQANTPRSHNYCARTGSPAGPTVTFAGVTAGPAAPSLPFPLPLGCTFSTYSGGKLAKHGAGNSVPFRKPATVGPATTHHSTNTAHANATATYVKKAESNVVPSENVRSASEPSGKVKAHLPGEGKGGEEA